MRVTARAAALAWLCLVVSPVRAGAQTDPDLSETARFRLGALRFTPSIRISSVGFDDNVFNEVVNPKRDRTAAVGPGVDLWLRMGRSRLSGRGSGQYLYFGKYDNQRSWNTNVEGRWDLPLSRLAPFIRARRNNTKDRPGYEIDSRVRLIQREAGFGTFLRLSGKTTLVVDGGQVRQRYDDEDLVLGDQIARSLDRDSTIESAQLRVQLTPLTTFVILGEAVQDRFRVSSGRDANSIKLAPGFDLRAGALISGKVSLGVRRFDGLATQMPDYTGFVSNASVSYVRRATKVDLSVVRDLVYSYEPLQPYYAQLGIGLTVTQRLTTRWDIVGRGGRQTLAYQNVTTSLLPERTDRLWQAGAGIGFRFAESLRLGVDATYFKRDEANTALRQYEALRVGASFSYGLTQ